MSIVGSRAELVPSRCSPALGCWCSPGLATGASWLCYFKALRSAASAGRADRQVEYRRVQLALLFLGRGVSLIGRFQVALLAVGTLLCSTPLTCAAYLRAVRDSRGWLLYAPTSAFFAALTATLGKPASPGGWSPTSYRDHTRVVLVMAWVMVAVTGGSGRSRRSRGELGFVLASGRRPQCATNHCCYRALQDGPASVVVPILKLSVLVTVPCLLRPRPARGRR